MVKYSTFLERTGKMRLVVIDLDTIVDIKAMKKSSKLFQLRNQAIIMLTGCSLTKTMVDNFRVPYHYFYLKDYSKMVKKSEFIIDNLTSLKDAIGTIQEYQNISDEEIFVFGRKLEDELLEEKYYILDLEDSFTEIYEKESEVISSFVKKIGNR